MNRYFFSFLFLFFFTSSLFAQTPTVVINNGKSCADQEVLLSVTATNLLNIKAITLYVDFDPAKLTFMSLENIDPQLAVNLLFNFIESPPKVAVAWNDNMTGADFQNKKLFDIKFHVKSNGPIPVGFTTGCQVADATLQPVTITWMNGAVIPANPVISTQPKNVTAKKATTAKFELVSNDATGYQWECCLNGTTWVPLQDGDIYNGTTTSLLTILSVQLSMNNNLFRCMTANGTCTTLSDAVMLTVEAASSVNDGSGMLDLQLGNQPNPFNEFTQINYTLPEEGNVHIRIYSVLGSQVADLMNASFLQGQYKIPFLTTQLPNGIYICLMEFRNKNSSVLVSRKMIKN